MQSSHKGSLPTVLHVQYVDMSRVDPPPTEKKKKKKRQFRILVRRTEHKPEIKSVLHKDMKLNQYTSVLHERLPLGVLNCV